MLNRKIKNITHKLAFVVFVQFAIPVQAGFLDELNKGVSDFGSALKDSVDKQITGRIGTGSSGGYTNPLEGTVLKDLFLDYPFDNGIDANGDEQYPKVAFTVHKMPNFGNKHSMFETNVNKLKKGCWSLSAVVWHSKRKSEKVPSIEWCTPDHIVRKVAYADADAWLGRPAFYPTYKKTTGAKRTNGPYTPEKAFPTDVRHKRLLGTDRVSVRDYNGKMLASLLYQMGFDWSVASDRRVWIVKFDEAYK